jgi:hypothetical protein
MVGERELLVVGNFLLSLFYDFITEFFHAAAFHADHMVVVLASIQFEDGIAALEVMPLDKPRRFKLGEHAVYGGQPDFLAFRNQGLVNLFGR